MPLTLTAHLLTVAGYLAYPFKVSSNILNSFAADDIAIQVSSCQQPSARHCLHSAG